MIRTPTSLDQNHLVRVGRLGEIGLFAAVDRTCYPRRARVIVRSERGMELGEVLASPGPLGGQAAAGTSMTMPGPTGAILRGMTDADELLALRLERNRQAALAACTARLAELRLPVALLDVEHSFDGRTLRFYFLGETTAEVEAVVAELAELYEAEVQIRSFAETLTKGCGPGCGTDEATGGGCGSCGTGCAVAGACSTKRH
ncbi:MAG TPA: PSP1 C-terminal domain-containing protein [Pirellulales bacterium]|nr:PSP1 C-terminal domain-containing protein [Pirellulales bacterium]